MPNPQYPTPAEAASLWTFGRETVVDGDRLAIELYWDRRRREWFRGYFDLRNI